MKQTKTNQDHNQKEEPNKQQYWIALNQAFAENNYPTQETKLQIANNFNKPILKITNWFKQKRRIQFLKGELPNQLQNYKKQRMTKQQQNILSNEFKTNAKPSKNNITQYAEKFHTTGLHIKNWFANQRLKVSLKQKQNSKENQEISQNISKYQYHTEIKIEDNNLQSIHEIQPNQENKDNDFSQNEILFQNLYQNSFNQYYIYSYQKLQYENQSLLSTLKKYLNQNMALKNLLAFEQFELEKVQKQLTHQK